MKEFKKNTNLLIFKIGFTLTVLIVGIATYKELITGPLSASLFVITIITYWNLKRIIFKSSK